MDPAELQPKQPAQPAQEDGEEDEEEEEDDRITGKFATVIKTDSLRVRKTSATYAQQIGRLTRGTTVAVWEYDDGWYKVDSNKNGVYDYKEDGWCFGDYLDVRKGTIGGNSTVTDSNGKKYQTDGTGKGIVGGYRNQNRSAVSQMALRRHSHGGVGDAVGQLCQGISGAWGDHQRIQQLLGANWFHFRDGQQGISAADIRRGFQMLSRRSEASVNGGTVLRENGDHIVVFRQLPHDGKHLMVCTEGAAQGKSDGHGTTPFPSIEQR